MIFFSSGFPLVLYVQVLLYSFTGELQCLVLKYRGADKSLARPGRKQATATEDFDFHISYL
jgi:hypothetical protein